MNRRERMVVRLAVALGVFMGLVGCQATAPAPQVETVGNLTAGPSVYSAPLAHDAPPALGFVAGSDDDAPGDVVTTTTRVDAGEPDAAPEVAPKADGLTMGTVR